MRRNASTRTYDLDYKASIAQWHAERRARRPKTAKLVVNDKLRTYVQERLEGAVLGADVPLCSGRRARRGRAATSRTAPTGAGCRGGARVPGRPEWTGRPLGPSRPAGVEAFLADLRGDLKAGGFTPLPVREGKIPKVGGKFRRLGVSATRDRVVQASLLLVLEPTFEGPSRWRVIGAS